MIVLNEGCSFSARSLTDEERSKKSVGNRVSYCDFLSGQIFNIASPGSGIMFSRVHEFVKMAQLGELTEAVTRRLSIQSPPLDGTERAQRSRMQVNTERWEALGKHNELTHFIFQVPSPSRQTLYLNLTDEEFFKAPMNYYRSSEGELFTGYMKKQLQRAKNRWGPGNIFKRIVDPENRRSHNYTQFLNNDDDPDNPPVKVHKLGSGQIKLAEPDDLSSDLRNLYLIPSEEFNKLSEAHYTATEGRSIRLVYDNFSWTLAKRGHCVPTSVAVVLKGYCNHAIDPFVMDLFEAQDRYFKKAIHEIDKAVCLLRKQWPNIKIYSYAMKRPGCH